MSANTGSADAGSAHIADEVDAEHELDLYRRMQLIRRFEERVYLVYLQGELPGTLHQSQGQEAVAVCVCDVLRPTDWITSTHRPHGHALAKGVDVNAAMAELYGKATGCCGGKGGSMHLGDPSVGMLPAIAIVGGGNTVVTGLGLAFKLMRTDQVAVCFFG
jgi:TPP-dependent pyruvate/acetoin dehydrogenase alpha subunit